MTPRQKLTAVAYLVLPVLLALWANSTDDVVQMKPYGTPLGGAVLIIGGAVLMLLGFSALSRSGADQLVTTGVYHWLPHPMYLGFALATLGIAMAARSPSGLWLVAPAVMLGCAALVWGYERPQLERRFPHAVHGYLWLPADHDGSPAGMARIRCWLFLLLPWVIIYEIIVWSGAPKDAFTLALPFERNLPPTPWGEPLYMSTYVVVTLTPLLARTSRSLRHFMIRGWLAMAIAFSLYLSLPVLAPLKPFHGAGFWGKALEFERTADPPLNAFPSFHTIWAFLSAELLVVGSGRWTRILWRLWAVGVAVSCVATGMHWIADVVAGIALSYALIRGQELWSALLSVARWMSGSWRYRRIYRVASAVVALAVVRVLIGPGHDAALALTTVAAVIGSSWGWYSGLAAMALSCLAAPWLGTPSTLLAAASCVAAPWLQIGSRLCFRPDPSGHRAQLASILWNIFAAIVLTRMWWAGCELHLIAGIFGLVNGMSRFVEEAYRRDIEAPVVYGLRVNQWFATVCVVAGAILTTLPMHGEAPFPRL